MAEVLFEKVTKIYPGGVEAVKGIDLRVRDEEFLVLVGPSGCGKSTTLRMTAGLEDISGGTIRIGERVVNNVSPKDRDIAMVFQNYALYPHMTVYKNMSFGLRLRRFKGAEIDRRVHNAARILGIEPLLKRRPKALSGGQRQRVAVGRAIVRDPAAFLFDEPLSNLDAKLRVETRAELKRLHKRLQTTTIYVTHDQEEAMTLGDRVVVMSDGLVQQCDTPLNVYRAPANRFVAGFLGTPPMNFFNGKLTREEEGGEAVRFDGEGVSIPLTAQQSRGVADRVGGEAVLGIRPEALFLDPNKDANDEQRAFTCRVDVTEPLGDRMDAYLHTSTDKRIVARVKAKHLSDADQVKLYMDMANVHVFEPGDYGLNLSIAAAPESESGSQTSAQPAGA